MIIQILCGLGLVILVLMVVLPSDNPKEKKWEDMTQTEKNISNMKALDEIYGKDK